MDPSVLSIRRHGSIVELNLARAPVNALNAALLDALAGAVEAAVEEGAQALVLSGRPGLFSAGIDVRELLGNDRAGVAEYWATFFGTLRTIASCAVPVGAAITGHSPAGGAVLALFCDYRVMAEGDFTIGLNEVRVGLPVPELILAALSRQVGARTAEHLAVGGRMLTPRRALEVGLVDRVVPLDEVLPATLEWAQELLSLPPQALRTTRANARADLRAVFDRIGPADAALMADRWMSDETQRTMRTVVVQLAHKKKMPGT